jgi:subtilisin family serine protease
VPVKVGIVDSGIGAAQRGSLAASIGIAGRDGERATRCVAVDDLVGHGTAVAAIILAQAPSVRLLSAQVFGATRRADPGYVAEALDWCIEQHARIINLSLGLVQDHDLLRAACASAVASGAIVVASAPARGARVYPAAYPGVIAVSGDARCTMREWSLIEPGQLYGAPPLGPDGVTPCGASLAAARISAQAATFVEARAGASADDFRDWLDHGAAFQGRERRQPEAVI